MQLSQIVELVNGTVITGEGRLDMEYRHGFASDMMSDVLAYVDEDTLLLTGLINAQVIRTAEMLDLKAILFVRGKLPAEDVIELAHENDIVLITTRFSLFQAAGELYKHGMLPCQV